MAHTNSTPNYHLPQFISTDKPAWLVDINAAYVDIDTGIKNAQDDADSAQADATQALLDSSTAMSTATQADAKASGSIASMAPTFSDTSTYSVGDYVIYSNILYKCIVAVTIPGSWSGTLNWERATVSSVANDIKSEISNLTASDIDYDSNNTVAEKIEDVESTILTVHSKNVNIAFDNSGEGTVTDPDINHILSVEDMMGDSGVYPAYIPYRGRGGGWRIKSLNRNNLNWTSSGIISSTRTVKIYYLA